MVTLQDVTDARRVLAAIDEELRAGTKHYAVRDGRELTTPVDIIRELLNHGRLSHVDIPTGRGIPSYLSTR